MRSFHGALFAVCLLNATLTDDVPAQTLFVRGDCNADGTVSGSVTDPIFLLEFVFLGGEEPPCLDACDVDDDGIVTGEVSDAIYLLSFSFSGGPQPPSPFPSCGADPTPDNLDECESFPTCPRNQPPTASFTFDPLVGATPARAVFNAAGSSDPDGRIAHYDWDFGDGETGTRRTAAHTYGAAGSYQVTLTVTDDHGATASDAQQYVVKEENFEPRFGTMVSEIKRELRSFGAPGVAVAVVEGGEVTFAAGFGSKHPNRSDPVEPTTLFRIGSVTKMLTALGLLQQVDAGRIDLEASITDYLPEFSFSRNQDWAPSITVKHLLTHSSAICDYLELDAPAQQEDGALAGYFNGPYGSSPFAYLMAPAGRMFNYSNPGFSLAGLLTETASGTYYRKYLDANVFTPLGMERTYLLPEEVLADGDYAHGDLGDFPGYVVSLPAIIEPDTYDNCWVRPAGYAFSSVLDLAEFLRFLRHGNTAVLDDDLRREMQEPQLDTELVADLLHYGYGLFVQEGAFYVPGSGNFYRLRAVSHGGDIPGFAADLYYVPDLDFGFVCLANRSLAHLQLSFLAALRTLCRLPAPVSPPDLSVNPAVDYVNYEGRYHDPNNAGRVIVSRAGDQLRVQLPDVGQSVAYDPVLEPIAPHNFILTIAEFPLVVTFILDAAGRAEYFRTRSFVARRDPGGGAGAAEVPRKFRAPPVPLDPHHGTPIPFALPLYR